MAMDMLEHEDFQAVSSLASRGTSQIISLAADGTNAEITKSFLIKRMEIEFFALADTHVDDASGTGVFPYVLMLHRNSVDNTVDSVAEQLDARLEDINAHQAIIWSRAFLIKPHIADDGDNVSDTGLDSNFKTSKSFSKGFRMDKDETYAWVVFNPGTAANDAIAVRWLRVRYWGVYIE